MQATHAGGDHDVEAGVMRGRQWSGPLAAEPRGEILLRGARGGSTIASVGSICRRQVAPRRSSRKVVRMSLQERFLANLVARGVARCLTGRPRDLALLLSLARVPIPNPGLSAFLGRLSRDLRDGSGLANLLLHVGRHANRRCKQRLIENIFFHWVVRGGRLRTDLRARGQWPPFFVVISPTMRCNLTCTGCYSGLYRKDGELSEQEIDRLLGECKAMGAYFVVFSGGEPYLLRESLLRLFRKHRDMFFLTASKCNRCKGIGNVRKIAEDGLPYLLPRSMKPVRKDDIIEPGARQITPEHLGDVVHCQ